MSSKMRKLAMLLVIPLSVLVLASCETQEPYDYGALEERIGGLEREVGTIREDFGTFNEEWGTFQEDWGVYREEIGLGD